MTYDHNYKSGILTTNTKISSVGFTSVSGALQVIYSKVNKQQETVEWRKNNSVRTNSMDKHKIEYLVLVCISSIILYAILLLVFDSDERLRDFTLVVLGMSYILKPLLF